jgi:hypothetical protein
MTTLEDIRKRKGMSNAGEYPHVASENFAGPNGTFPINTMARARSALARAHFAEDPEAIRQAVYKKYPSLRKPEK